MKGSCIADSVFTPPAVLAKGFNILTSEFGSAYGEVQSIQGTPFVSHSPFLGGMCAQACCFMASMLSLSSAKSVHGIAEISPVDELKLG